MSAPGDVAAGDRRGPRRILRWAVPVAVLAVASWLVVLPLGVVDQTHLPTCACGDVAQEVWIFAVVRDLVAHGTLTSTTAQIDVPRGISLLDNASFPLVAVLLAPVTAVLGPVASLVLALRLAFFLSGVSCWAVLRRLVPGELAALVGGLLYSLSPYMTHQAASHFFLVLGPVPPIALWLVARAVSSDAGSSQRAGGLALGGLAVVQFLVDSEVLVILALATAVTLVVVGGWSRIRGGMVRPATGRLAALLGWGLCVAVPLLAWPAWETVAGPERIVGATQPQTSAGTNLLATLLPADRGVLAGRWSWWRIAPQTFLGHASYIGVPLLLVCVVVVVRHRHDRLVGPVAVLGVVSWVFQLGAHLQVGHHDTGIPLPFDLLRQVPVLEDVISVRFAQLSDLAVAVLVAVGVGRLAAAARRRVTPVLLAPAAVIAAGVALVAPVAGYGAAGIGGAAAFAGTLPPSLSSGGTVLAYPYPAFPDDQAMLWQAESGMRFRLLGGYAIRPGPGRVSVRTPLTTAPRAVADAFLLAHRDPAALRVGTAGWEAAARALPALVARSRVTAVLVQRDQAGAAVIEAMVRSRYGPPGVIGGVDVWSTSAGTRPAVGAGSART